MDDISDIKINMSYRLFGFNFLFLIFENKKRASVMCFQEDFNEDRIVFVCFVCLCEGGESHR